MVVIQLLLVVLQDLHLDGGNPHSAKVLVFAQFLDLGFMDGQFADLLGEGVWLALVNLVLDLVIHADQETALHQPHGIPHLIGLVEIQDDVSCLEHEPVSGEVREEGLHLGGDLSGGPSALYVMDDAGDYIH